MARVLIVGGNGQLGRELVIAGWPAGLEPVATTRSEVDVTRPRSVESAVTDVAPALVVNASAYTQVDRAEQEPEAAAAVNHHGCVHLADACRAHDVPLVHVSTDYVFDGEKSAPYVEEDEPRPLGVYGSTKLAGEEAIRERWPRHLILRTSWLFGAHRQNFVETMLRLAGERDELRIVDDQVGCPTPARDLATAIVGVAERIATGAHVPWGLYHCAGRGETTWFGFAREIFEQASRLGVTPPRLLPIGTADYPTPARRPAHSVLGCSKLKRELGIAMPDWRRGLTVVLEELIGNERSSA